MMLEIYLTENKENLNRSNVTYVRNYVFKSIGNIYAHYKQETETYLANCGF